MPFYRKILNANFAERIARNPRYSLRAFATSLGMDSSVCSQLLSGKRVPSIAVAERLIERLGLDIEEKEAFLRSIGEEKLRAGLRRVNPRLRALARSGTAARIPDRRDLSLDAFQAIAGWYHYAILELTKLRGFRESPAWISRELGITESEAKLGLERLIELQMLERRDGKLRKTRDGFFTADPHLTTAAHKRRQKEILDRSVESLESEPISRRNHSGMTVAIDPALLPEAKKRIAAFLRGLSDFLESGGPKEVYEIQLSLFSLHVSHDSKTMNKEKSK